MLPNALPSLWNAASHYSGHGPIQSCLDKEVNSNSNEIRHHVIKHNVKDSNYSLHGGVGFGRLGFNDTSTQLTKMVTGPITNSPINHILFTSMTPAMVRRKGNTDVPMF